MGFNEKMHAFIAAKFYVHLTETFGERGKQAFIHATQYYAMQRGRRMAQRAIRDGQPLTQATYNYYGEWVSTEEIKAMGHENQSELMEDGSMRITQCPWHMQFRDMGLTEAGAEYCRHLDSAISRGFNPYLNYVVDQTLHTADCCIHKVLAEPIATGSERGKNPASLKDFEYHCAHSYWAYAEVAEAIFEIEGDNVNQKVLEDVRNNYGEDIEEILLKYQDFNFNRI